MYTLETTGVFSIDDPPETYIYHIEPIADEIAAISSDDCLRLINPAFLNGPVLKIIPKTHTEVTCLKALDGQSPIACTAGRDGRVNIWDVRGNTVVAELNTGIAPFRCLYSIAFYELQSLQNWGLSSPARPKKTYLMASACLLFSTS